VQSGAPGGSILSGKAAFDRLRDVKGNTATKNLYVYGYGDRTTESHLRKLFSQYAVVVDVCVKSGFSFVNTTDRSKAIIARENLVNTPLNGGFLGINFAKN
jgi:RNA recognition motif-containing protein